MRQVRINNSRTISVFKDAYKDYVQAFDNGVDVSDEVLDSLKISTEDAAITYIKAKYNTSE